MQAVFLIARFWDLTVLWGNLLSGGVGVLNFFLMGLTVQSALGKEEKKARQLMRLSQTLRLLMMFAVIALGAYLPCFHIAALLIPLIFPRLAVFARPLIRKKKKGEDTNEA